MIQLSALLLGVFLFLSVSIGGVIAWFVSKLFRKSEVGLSLLCGGFLIGLLANDIVPDALKMYGIFGIFLGILVGYMFFLVLSHLFHPTNHQNPSVYLLTIALFIHTIPLSMTIGSLLGDSTFGATVTTSTILHHLPEGFALTAALLSQGKKLWGLFFCFIGLSIFFSLFIWVGQHIHLTMRAQTILIGVSIGLIASTSIKEFILHNIRAMSVRFLLIFVITGYLLSHIFHLFL